MRQRIKGLIKAWAPPALIRLIRSRNGITWSGNYVSWQDAVNASSGYDSKEVLHRVEEATVKVIRGLAQCERDSVTFDTIQYSWPLLSGLLWVALQSNGLLNLIDFGGSLGSTFLQNRKFLNTLPRLSWNIVEQGHFVKAGKRLFKEGAVKFFGDMETCLKQENPNTILFSSVLQYLEDPYATLEKVNTLGFEFVLIDRTPFIARGPERLTVQRVPSSIYPASYPCWFFDRRKFYNALEPYYQVIEIFGSLDTANIPSFFEGCILRRKP